MIWDAQKPKGMELFGTAGIRGPVSEVTPKLTLAIGQAVSEDAMEVVVARDGRETGETLAAAVEAGLTSGGADIRRAGQLPTPGLAYASQGRHGVMITASHNPPQDNGIKLFTDGQEFDRDSERRIEERVARTTLTADWNEWGKTEQISPLPSYLDTVTGYASRHGDEPDFSVAVDCGNGMASLATPQALRELGAKVVTLNANVDGYFPGRESKPTPESLTDLRQFVADGPANIGIGHDGDADRIVIVDSDGDIVHEDTVLAILAEHYTRASEAADPVVVTTPNASGRIDERVRDTGGRVERVRLGALHEGIAAVRENGDEETVVTFAAEPWKHIHPALGTWIDGVTSAAIFVRLVAANGLYGLRKPIAERPYHKESVSCPDDAKNEAMERLATSLPETFPEATVDTEHGVRLELPDSAWTLVRPSGTEPYIRVYAESNTVDELTETVVNCVETAIDES